MKGGVIARGVPTGPKVFLSLPDACGLKPCDQNHLKNGLVLHSCVGGTYDKYRGLRMLSGAALSGLRKARILRHVVAFVFPIR